MRVDANVSVRPVGTEELGTRVEIKNMNSVRSLGRAVEYEIARQIDVVESGGRVVQETRHWDEAAGVTHGMRSKEGSEDYRYFPEPDLVPVAPDGRRCATSVRRGRRAAGRAPGADRRRLGRVRDRRADAARGAGPRRLRGGRRRRRGVRARTSPIGSPARSWGTSTRPGSRRRSPVPARGAPRSSSAWSPTGRSPASSPRTCSSRACAKATGRGPSSRRGVSRR